MSKRGFVALLAMLMSLTSGAQEPRQNQGIVWGGSDSPSAIELIELNNEITGAPADQAYYAHMLLDKPARLDSIREVANHLKILRLLAFVEYGPSGAGGERSTIAIGLGTLYEGDEAWRHETCKVKLSESVPRDDKLLQMPAEEWVATEVHVYGTAHAVRELRSGVFLPKATITDGGASGARSPRPFISYVKSELAKTIPLPDRRVVPEECREFAERREVAILTGQPTIQSPDYRNLHNPEFRSAIYPFLAERLPDTPVTMRIVFNSDVGVDYLAELVEQYEIDGLTASLEPVGSDRRMSVEAWLSVHGGSIDSQVDRTRCFMKLGNGAQVSGDWLGRSARVSVPVSKAWGIIAHQDLADAKLLNDFEVGALAAVEAHHRRLETQVFQISPTDPVPPGCAQFMQHRQ